MIGTNGILRYHILFRVVISGYAFCDGFKPVNHLCYWDQSISTLQRKNLKLLIARIKAEVVDPQEYVITVRLLPLLV